MTRLLLLPLATSLLLADVSYVQTTKSSVGGLSETLHRFIKGQKVKTASPLQTTIVDLQSGTGITLHHRRKRWTVQRAGSRSPTMANASKIEIKETGEHKVVNGYNTREFAVTMDGGPVAQAPETALQLAASVWMATSIPGAAEVHGAERRGDAMLNGINAPAGAARAAAALQQRLGTLEGVVVRQVITI